MRIALIHPNYELENHLDSEYTPLKPNSLTDHVNNVRESLKKGGHQVILIEVSNDLLNDIETAQPLDLLFNLSTGILDKRMQANIVGLLELTQIPILGSGLSTHIVGLHKGITKSLLQAHGIPTSYFQLFKDQSDKIDSKLTFPVIVKPEHEGSGIGVTASSKVDSAENLQTIISEKMTEHDQVIIVEEYLPGREFTVGVMGNQTLQVLPIQETILPKDGPQVLTSEMKAKEEYTTQIPADISEQLKDEIETLATQVFRLLRCEEFIRIDFRLDKDNQPNIIELNTYPGLIEDYSFFPNIAKVAGYSYSKLMNELVALAAQPKNFIP